LLIFALITKVLVDLLLDPLNSWWGWTVIISLLISLSLQLTSFNSTASGREAESRYKNLPESRVESMAFNNAISSSEQDAILRDCNEKLILERRRLVAFGVTRFLNDPRFCTKVLLDETSSVFRASLVWLHDQN